jgi:hypothetical protein
MRRRHGALRYFGCHETIRGVWLCTMRFHEGLIAVERAAWHQNAHALGISLVTERKG